MLFQVRDPGFDGQTADLLSQHCCGCRGAIYSRYAPTVAHQPERMAAGAAGEVERFAGFQSTGDSSDEGNGESLSPARLVTVALLPICKIHILMIAQEGRSLKMVLQMSAWSRVFLGVVLASTLALGVFGIGRSLWLDEAWVANSIQAATLREMFFYPDWLQTSPPVFLLLSRATVQLLGLSNTAFRVVPLGFALIAAGALFSLARRVLSLPWAVLACVLVVFHPAFIEYSHSAKQYSGEVAATVLVLLAAARYLESQNRSGYLWLTGTLVVALFAAYPVAFLLPGVLVAVFFTNVRRAAGLAIVTSATLLTIWVVFIRPNTAPELRAFWAADAEALFTPRLIAAMLLVLLLTIRLLTSPTAWRQWTLLICAIPCLLLAMASIGGWYPATQRMRLWVLPCFVMLCVSGGEDLLGKRSPRIFGALALGFALFFASVNVRNQIRERRDLPEEDFAGAFSYLKEHVGPSDLLLVHAAAREGFRLYSAMGEWSGPPPFYGNTGWPCCARGRNAWPGTSTEAAVIADINAMIPERFFGKIWLFYPTRPSHWTYVGLNEGDLWRKLVWEKGCPPGTYKALANLAISPMDCGPGPALPSTRIR